MERVYLEFNLPNLITVVIMATVGMAMVGFVASAIRTYAPKAAAA